MKVENKMLLGIGVAPAVIIGGAFGASTGLMPGGSISSPSKSKFESLAEQAAIFSVATAAGMGVVAIGSTAQDRPFYVKSVGATLGALALSTLVGMAVFAPDHPQE
jgi:hypothetical protein